MSEATAPQFTLSTLLSCVAIIAGGLASCTQLGGYSVSILPLCVTLLVALAGGGNWKDGLWLSLYVYGIAISGVVLLGAMMLLAVAVAT